MSLRMFLAIIAVFAFVSCSGAGDSNNGGGADNAANPPVTPPGNQFAGKTPLEIVKQLEEEGKYPKLDRDEQNLLGEDKNNDGVRDDIEKYINETYTNADERKAVRQYAKTVRDQLAVDITDQAAVDAMDKKSGDVLMCVLDTFARNGDREAGRRAWKAIQAMTTNTKERYKKYMAYNHALDGTTWTLPDEDTCEK